MAPLRVHDLNLRGFMRNRRSIGQSLLRSDLELGSIGVRRTRRGISGSNPTLSKDRKSKTGQHTHIANAAFLLRRITRPSRQETNGRNQSDAKQSAAQVCLHTFVCERKVGGGDYNEKSKSENARNLG